MGELTGKDTNVKDTKEIPKKEQGKKQPPKKEVTEKEKIKVGTKTDLQTVCDIMKIFAIDIIDSNKMVE